MTPGALALNVRKEIRALAPAWAACAAALVVTLAIGWVAGPLGRWVYLVGAVALGAASMGHEYSQRTLTLLLAQPIARRRLLLAKAGVLALLLLALAALFKAGLSLPQPYVWSRGASPLDGAIVPVAFVLGFLVAPWFTMLCRSALAGLVFALAAPAATAMLLQLIGLHAVGTLFAMTIVWGLVAAIDGPRRFLRLEVIEGPMEDLELPLWPIRASRESAVAAGRESCAPARFRSPVWSLAGKELRLQQVSFLVAALYVVAWIGIRVAISDTSPSRSGVTSSFSMLYACFVTLLVASVASAEERQLRTLEWQALLPLGSRAQWAVKVAVSVAIVIGLAVALPLLLDAADPTVDLRAAGDRELKGLAVFLTLLFAVGLYVSSCATSALRAMITSLALGPAIMLLFGSLLVTTSYFWLSPRVYRGVGAGRLDFTEAARLLTAVRTWTPLVLVALGVALLLRFAAANHRSADRSPGRIVAQVLLTIACVAGLVMAVFGGLALRFGA